MNEQRNSSTRTGRPDGQPLQLSTSIGHANAQRVHLRGRDLVDDLLGHLTYTQALLLAITGELPGDKEAAAVDAVLVSLIDHGMQPSALAARMTYHAAPDAIQGAVAAGLLGAGSELLGSMEQAGKMLHEVAEVVADGATANEAARTVVNRILAAGKKIPGFGHNLHRAGDPRASRLLRVADELGVAGTETAWLKEVGAVAKEVTGRDLMVNATGASAAILLAVGVPWQLHRGLAMISRAAGLVAHIGEEMAHPITPEVRRALRQASWLDEGESDE